MVSSNIVDSFDDETAKAFFEALNGDKEYEFKNPAGFPIEVMKEGKAEGPVIGGNLSLISAAMGTPYEMDAKGKIIFFEEVSEPVTKIEKWCYHLKNSGKFKDCKGILLGQFTDITNEFMPEYTVIDCIREIIDDVDVPVMYNLQAGHGEKNITIPFGTNCIMDTEKKSITFDIDR